MEKKTVIEYQPKSRLVSEHVLKHCVTIYRAGFQLEAVSLFYNCHEGMDLRMAKDIIEDCAK